ncbi:O-fucosyltransferase 7 isoform X2 [Jatropha curcas]|uniref:O-fucosyltransferase 7 isoform X2 n=1 Tax=Jatropha curcas TaxID=180498 RepID=UPI0005FBDE0A|nr:O-fucosyltransferase 7 isoform X2 [Jatropha curcas]
MQKRRWRAVVVMRKLLTCAICAMTMVALFSVHIRVFPSTKVPDLPDPYKLPATTTQHEINKYSRLENEQEQNLSRELTPPHLSKPPLPAHKLGRARGNSDFAKLWKPPPNRDFLPCVDPSSNYTTPGESRGYLLVHTNGGLNQMRAGICDMVAVARIINATLVVPELDKRSFWQDTSNFSDVFDEDHFINALANDVKVIKKLPKEMANAAKAVKHFRSWSGMDYYQLEIASMWEDYQVIRAAKSDSRLANNNLPPDIQKLRCRACYEALRFSPQIEAMGKMLVDRMRSYGPYIALHLRYEKDMLAFSGCTHGLSSVEADELKKIREETVYWKVKEIDSRGQRFKGYCPLTPKEVAVFLSALGYPSNTPIYIASGEIYGGDARMADLQSRYPILMSKEKLASVEELEPFINHASQMAALDYIVSVESDVFIPSYSGNMARAVEGHRRFLGHRKTISPDRKSLVHLFDKIERGKMKEGEVLSKRIIEMHRRRQGSPRRRKGPISGTKGMDRFRSEEAFYVNPLPDCLCQRQSSNVNNSLVIR